MPCTYIHWHIIIIYLIFIIIQCIIIITVTDALCFEFSQTSDIIIECGLLMADCAASMIFGLWRNAEHPG